MQYSPKLKKVMAEIIAILEKNDVAGLIILHTLMGEVEVLPDATYAHGFSEYNLHVNTSYSAGTFDGDRFVLKGKAAHWPSKEVRDQKVNGAINMFDHLATRSALMSMEIIKIKEAMEPIIDRIRSTERGGGSSSNTEQNN